jgi:hypothetical protein
MGTSYRFAELQGTNRDRRRFFYARKACPQTFSFRRLGRTLHSQFMSGIFSIAAKIGKPSDPHLYGIFLLLVQFSILDWTYIPGLHPVDAALQLIRGGILPFLTDALIYGPQGVNFPTDSMGTVYMTGCRSIASWLACHSIYPPTFKEMHDSLCSIEFEKRCTRLGLPKRGNLESVHWTMCVWNVIMMAFRSKAEVWDAVCARLHNGEPVFCDNASVGCHPDLPHV